MRMIERQAEHKRLRKVFAPLLTELKEGEVFSIGESSIINVNNLGYLVFKDHESTKNNEYFGEVKGIKDLSYCWVRETSDDALRLISLDSLKEAEEDYDLISFDWL